MDHLYDVIINGNEVPWKNRKESNHGFIYTLSLLSRTINSMPTSDNKTETMKEIDIKKALEKDPYVMLIDTDDYCSGLASILVERINSIELYIPFDPQFPLITRYLKQVRTNRFAYIKAITADATNMWTAMTPLAVALATTISPMLFYNGPSNYELEQVTLFQRQSTGEIGMQLITSDPHHIRTSASSVVDEKLVDQVSSAAKNCGGVCGIAKAYAICDEERKQLELEKWTEAADKSRKYFTNCAVSLKDKMDTLKKMEVGNAPEYLLAPLTGDEEDVDTTYLSRITPKFQEIYEYLSTNSWSSIWVGQDKPTIGGFLKVSHGIYEDVLYCREKLKDLKELVRPQPALWELALIFEQELDDSTCYSLWNSIRMLYNNNFSLFTSKESLFSPIDYIGDIIKQDTNMTQVWNDVSCKSMAETDMVKLHSEMIKHWDKMKCKRLIKKEVERFYRDLMTYLEASPSDFANNFTIEKINAVYINTEILIKAHKTWVEKQRELLNVLKTSSDNNMWCTTFIEYLELEATTISEIKTLQVKVVDDYAYRDDLYRWPDCSLKSYLNALEMNFENRNEKLNSLFPRVFKNRKWNHWEYNGEALNETVSFLNLWSRTIAVVGPQQELWPTLFPVKKSGKDWNEKIFKIRLQEWLDASFTECVEKQEWPGGTFENPEPQIIFPQQNDQLLADNGYFASIAPHFINKFNQELHTPQANVLKELKNARDKFHKVVEQFSLKIAQAKTVTELFEIIKKISNNPWQCLEFLVHIDFLQNDDKILKLLELVQGNLYRDRLCTTKHRVGFPGIEIPKQETIDESGLRAYKQIQKNMAKGAKILYSTCLELGQKLAKEYHRLHQEWMYQHNELWTGIIFNEMHSISRGCIRAAAKSMEADCNKNTASIIEVALDRLLGISTQREFMNAEVLTWLKDGYCAWTLYNSSCSETLSVNTFIEDVICASFSSTLNNESDQKILLTACAYDDSNAWALYVYSKLSLYYYCEDVPSTKFSIAKRYSLNLEYEHDLAYGKMDELILKPSTQDIITLETARLVLTKPEYFLNTYVLKHLPKTPIPLRYCINKNGSMCHLSKSNTYWTPDILKGIDKILDLARDKYVPITEDLWKSMYVARLTYNYKSTISKDDEDQIISELGQLNISDNFSKNTPILTASPSPSLSLPNIKTELEESLKAVCVQQKQNDSPPIKEVEEESSPNIDAIIKSPIKKHHLFIETTDLETYVESLCNLSDFLKSFQSD